jgi:hypothetical protein
VQRERGVVSERAHEPVCIRKRRQRTAISLETRADTLEHRRVFVAYKRLERIQANERLRRGAAWCGTALNEHGVTGTS